MAFDIFKDTIQNSAVFSCTNCNFIWTTIFTLFWHYLRAVAQVWTFEIALLGAMQMFTSKLQSEGGFYSADIVILARKDESPKTVSSNPGYDH